MGVSARYRLIGRVAGASSALAPPPPTIPARGRGVHRHPATAASGCGRLAQSLAALCSRLRALLRVDSRSVPRHPFVRHRPAGTRDRGLCNHRRVVARPWSRGAGHASADRQQFARPASPEPSRGNAELLFSGRAQCGHRQFPKASDGKSTRREDRRGAYDARAICSNRANACAGRQGERKCRVGAGGRSRRHLRGGGSGRIYHRVRTMVAPGPAE